jgi:hypothetical protein
MFLRLCCTIAHHYHKEAMPLSLKSRFCGHVHIIQCQGRMVAGDEVKSLETALDLASREVPRIVLNMSEVDRVDSIGICYETVLGSLKALTPKATALQLAADFKSRDALDASDALLQLFGAQPQLANLKSPAQ